MSLLTATQLFHKLDTIQQSIDKLSEIITSDYPMIFNRLESRINTLHNVLLDFIADDDDETESTSRISSTPSPMPPPTPPPPTPSVQDTPPATTVVTSRKYRKPKSIYEWLYTKTEYDLLVYLTPDDLIKLDTIVPSERINWIIHALVVDNDMNSNLKNEYKLYKQSCRV